MHVISAICVLKMPLNPNQPIIFVLKSWQRSISTNKRCIKVFKKHGTTFFEVHTTKMVQKFNNCRQCHIIQYGQQQDCVFFAVAIETAGSWSQQTIARNRLMHRCDHNMRIRLAPRSMTLDDLELLQVTTFWQRFVNAENLWNGTMDSHKN